jgi:hypothetical protein
MSKAFRSSPSLKTSRQSVRPLFNWPARGRFRPDAEGVVKEQAATEKNQLIITGASGNGMKYAVRLAVVNDGGSLAAAGGKIEFKGCSSLTLVLTARTDYVMDYSVPLRHFNADR